MKMTMRQLRRIIRECLAEAGGAVATKPRATETNPMSPSLPDREELGRNSIRDLDVDEVSPHLREPMYDPEDCWGPVPPVGDNPHVGPDPFTRDYHVIPTPQIKR